MDLIIKATSASSDAGRSEAVSLLIVDEAAFIEQIGEIWASAQQTLATGGGAIVLSTPYGTGNWFHKTWVSAENKENDFLPIKVTLVCSSLKEINHGEIDKMNY